MNWPYLHGWKQAGVRVDDVCVSCANFGRNQRYKGLELPRTNTKVVGEQQPANQILLDILLSIT